MTIDYLPGNRLTLLNSGAEYFPALLAAIDEAQHQIHLESYIFANDSTGRLITDALLHAAWRGVAVRVLVDGFGAREFIDALLPTLRIAGAEVLVYRPDLARLRLRRHRLRRLHRKLVVIDGCIAFVGGINIADDFDAVRHTSHRYDYAVRVEGSLLTPIQQTMARLWEIVARVNFKRRQRGMPPASSRRLSSTPVGEQRAALVVRDNFRHRRDIEDAYLEAIAEARNSILIANAYFLPGRRFRHALLDAAQRGVHVIVLLQGRIEYRLLHYATQALYHRLLGAGIRIFEYQRSFLHAKVAVVDDDWATVGSSNIDPFSLLLAREANIVVRDAQFAQTLRSSLEAALRTGAQELAPKDWRQLPWHSRLLRWMSFYLVRIAIGIAGYGGKH